MYCVFLRGIYCHNEFQSYKLNFPTALLPKAKFLDRLVIVEAKLQCFQTVCSLPTLYHFAFLNNVIVIHDSLERS